VVYLGLQNEREWARFCETVLERPDLARDPRFVTNALRVDHHDALAAIVTASFAGRTGAQVIERLEAAGIANARMRSMEEFLDHPQLHARDRWREVDSPVGPIRALVPPFNISGVEPVMGRVPALGEHTDAILHEVGIAAATVAEWRRAGVV
jgi:itaconate CoA-transferase